jgi:Holliday junction resolvase
MLDIFYIIIMKTKNNKTLYLKANDTHKLYEWTFNFDDAIWFDTTSECERFANEWFKTFKNYEIKEIGVNINTLKVRRRYV